MMPDVAGTAIQQSKDVFMKPQRALIYQVDENFKEVKDSQAASCEMHVQSC